MKIAVIGATGFVGSKVVAELLQRGHHVTAIARNTSKLPKHPALTAKATNAYVESELAAAIGAQDAVVNAFNPGWTDPNIQANFVKGFATITQATKKAGVKRYVVVGGAGSLEVAPGVQLVDTPQFPAEYKEGALGAREALNQLRKETALDWAFVSPAVFLEPGKRTGKYKLGGDQVLMNAEGPARISVEDLAVAIADELEQPKHHQQRFTAAN